MKNDDRFVDIILIIAAITVITLKITTVITISWLVLFSPFLFLMGLGILFMVSITLTYLIRNYIKKGEKNNERY